MRCCAIPGLVAKARKGHHLVRSRGFAGPSIDNQRGERDAAREASSRVMQTCQDYAQLADDQPDVVPISVAEARQLDGRVVEMSAVLVGAGPQSHCEM